MTTSVWRFAHLILAIFSFLFILMASITGAILSFEPINEKALNYKVSNFNQITLNQAIPVLKNKYAEIFEITVDENQFVTLQGFDEDGNDINKIINPITGEILSDPLVQSNFFQWVTSLHRSLFLHETGRFIIGFVSFLLLLIVITGTILIIKRQQGIKHFFSKVTKDYFAQYYHVAGGRLLLIPIFIIAFTASYLFLVRFEVINSKEISTPEIIVENNIKSPINIQDLPAFSSIYLKDVVKIEFPFDDSAEEYYKIKFTDKELYVSQITGNIVGEILYPKTKVFETLSLDLHTGRTNSIWAIILGIAAINIMFFIWSGFVMTYKRTKTKIGKNKIDANQAEYIIFVGSENGTTLNFANKIHEQLLHQNIKSFVTTLNQYQVFPKATNFIVFSSTYGIGEAPTNAKKFETLFVKHCQAQNINFSIVGFGSRAYKDFCAYAIQIDNLLTNTNGFNKLINLHTVNDKSPEEFVLWVKKINQIANLKLDTTPGLYVAKLPRLTNFQVISISNVTNNDTTFTVSFKTNKKFQSGDLLAIYPDNDYKERLYSIGKVNGNLQLSVKLHEFGLGSQFLYQLVSGQNIQARLVKNPNFHFPKLAKQVILIGNGTGIAPFYGMISENVNQVEIHLYAGFRYQNQTTNELQNFAESSINQLKLKTLQIAFSRENQKQYVMDLVKKDAKLIASILQNNGVIMLCGSLAMQTDVEKVLNQICLELNKKPLEFYFQNKQILTDCY